MSCVGDTEHYLLLCQSNEEPRLELLNVFNAVLPPRENSSLSNKLLVELILYGNEMLPSFVDKRLIQATVKFIQATKRF